MTLTEPHSLLGRQFDSHLGCSFSLLTENTNSKKSPVISNLKPDAAALAFGTHESLTAIYDEKRGRPPLPFVRWAHVIGQVRMYCNSYDSEGFVTASVITGTASITASIFR
jgi:hypothetical protein